MNNEETKFAPHILPSEGYVRLNDFIGVGKLLPISRSSWYALMRAGKAPKPVAIGPRTAVYTVASIRTFISTINEAGRSEK
jgi:predicted DNA-binding transcriptional regulator AlpA